MSLGNIFPDKYFPTKMFTLPQLQLEKLLDAGLKLKQGREKGDKEVKASFDPRKPWLLNNILPQPASTSAACSLACERRKKCSNLSEVDTTEMENTQFQVGSKQSFAWLEFLMFTCLSNIKFQHSINLFYSLKEDLSRVVLQNEAQVIVTINSLQIEIFTKF